MTPTQTVTKDPICGMTVDPATAIHAQRDGETFYFCSEPCQQKFLTMPADASQDDKSGCSCD